MYPRALNKAAADMLGLCWSCESSNHKAPWHHRCTNHLKKSKCCSLIPKPGETVWDLLKYPRKLSNEESEAQGLCWSCGEMGHMCPWCVSCKNHYQFRPFQVTVDSNSQTQSEQPSQNSQSQEDEQEMQVMSQESLTQVEAAEANAVDVVILCTMEATQDTEAASQTQTATGSQAQLGTWTSPRATKAIDRLSPTHGAWVKRTTTPC